MKKFICEYRTFDGSAFSFIALGERALIEALMFARDDDRIIEFIVNKVEVDDDEGKAVVY